MRAEQERHAGLEREIADHLARGDLRAAATVAIQGYGPGLLLWLGAVLYEEDAAQEVFSRFTENLWKGLGSFRGGSSFKTWAYQVAWNALRNYLRDPYLRRGRRLASSEISRIAEDVRLSSAAHLKSEIKSRVANLREHLSHDEQALLILRIDRGMSWSEVSQVLSEPSQPLDEVVLRNRFQRLKAKLRKIARAQGLIG